MGFKLFKKVNFADTIFENGNIYTQDVELPWAGSVAVRDGKIERVGLSSDMNDILGPDTKVVDLKGRFVYPGFIDIHRSHTMRLFNEKYVDLKLCKSTEAAASTIEMYIEENGEKDVIFAYGFDSEYLPENTEGWENPLDKIETDKPIVVLCSSTVEIWTNQIAKDIAQETADEECVDIITPNYILNLLLPFNFDELTEDYQHLASDLADKGFTTILDLQSPQYLQQFFTDAVIAEYNEERLKQRVYMSQYQCVPLKIASLLFFMDKQKTMCTELGSLIHADTLNLYLDNENSSNPFNQEYLTETLLAVADKGYTFFIEAINESDVIMAYEAVDEMRSKGYKNNVIIASDYKLPDEKMGDLLFSDSVFTTWGSSVMAEKSITGEVKSMEEHIDELTVYAAEMLGMDNVLGSIQEGKFADFCVFSENILGLTKDAKLPQCEMTVMNGEIVHDLDNEVDMEMYDIMSGQQL